MTLLRYNAIMKTELEIEIKKIRKQLHIYGLTEEEKSLLRKKLAVLKVKLKEQRENSIKQV
ncbi:MAG: hypothetical protein FAF03_09530 [Epsilonproteobacteria bacterium]|nr:hypothetical protein [Campylobacterota bacterium]